jgi:UDP-N-acetylmuramoyl-tripeptide--D-alanyl-D-alanine ligase
MIKLKQNLYFLIAAYFRFFATRKLKRWNPKIILVTGSTGKTTLLHLIEAQLGDKARYSHHANSSYGIPFDILGLTRKTLKKSEWIPLILKAPFKSLSATPRERLYVVEADCDRPNEGKFLSQMLRPEITIWLSLGRTHSGNFDKLVHQKKFKTVEEAIAHEFGYYLENTTKRAILNADEPLLLKQLERAKIESKKLTESMLNEYEVTIHGTKFKINNVEYTIKHLLPQESWTSVAAAIELAQYLQTPIDPHFTKLTLPPGRSALFNGIKNTTIIDSSYNASLSAMQTMLKMTDKIDHPNKWIVISDIVELGEEEREEHEKLADIIASVAVQRIILMGPRVIKYTYPRLSRLVDNPSIIEKFVHPQEIVHFLKHNLQENSLLFFKGSRFLEGVIEPLLKDKQDANKLPRREEIWQERRKQWGL